IRGAGAGAAGFRPLEDRRVQAAALDRVRRGAAEDRDREDAALQAAPGCLRRDLARRNTSRPPAGTMASRDRGADPETPSASTLATHRLRSPRPPACRNRPTWRIRTRTTPARR